ncbi:MAG: hypothetical protein K9L70_12435 [Thiohalocapsa sp.]|nr:hypothetical protein [Thiohalocapsa sp.]MCF7993170.1 hypothetical protein [Thiohalocapsa sp.]
MLQGHVEALTARRLPSGGIDLILSNRVINLSPDRAAVPAGAFELPALGIPADRAKREGESGSATVQPVPFRRTPMCHGFRVMIECQAGRGKEP